jgi:hypothetical protein
MLSKAATEHPTLQVVENKFLEPGHNHLECDLNHTCIEIGKKRTTVEIRVSQDQYLFVQSVRRKTSLKNLKMKREDFLSFSVHYQKCLMKENVDSARQKFS